MEPTYGEVDKNEALTDPSLPCLSNTGRKKSRFKQLKMRLFGKLKKKQMEGVIKQSQSAWDIAAQPVLREGYDSEEDGQLRQCLSSRALSHDSIFVPDHTTDPPRVLSQDNIHGKIKALQVQLQQQNLHLNCPPVLIPGKRREDSGTTSEDDGLPCSPTEYFIPERVTREAPYQWSRPLSPDSGTSLPPSISTTPVTEVDYMGRLDNSAARHRLSVKPRNQRASTKGNRTAKASPKDRSGSFSDLDNVLSEQADDGAAVISYDDQKKQEKLPAEKLIQTENLFPSTFDESRWRTTTDPWYSLSTSLGETSISSVPPSEPPKLRPERIDTEFPGECLPIQKHDSEELVCVTESKDKSQPPFMNPVDLKNLSPSGSCEILTKAEEDEPIYKALNSGPILFSKSCAQASKEIVENQHEEDSKDTLEMDGKFKPRKDNVDEMIPLYIESIYSSQGHEMMSVLSDASKATAGISFIRTDDSTEGKFEEFDNRKSAFGVQLRKTLMSLKSPNSNLNDESKRHSLESDLRPAVSEGHAGKSSVNSQLPSKKNLSKNQETIGNPKVCEMETCWMSLARMKIKNQSANHPSPLLAPLTQFTTFRRQHTAQEDSHSSPRSSTLPPSAAKDTQDKFIPTDRSTALNKGTWTTEAASKIEKNGRNRSETSLAVSSAASADTSPQPRSGGHQPSWMELAKRKSLAWTDKTLE